MSDYKYIKYKNKYLEKSNLKQTNNMSGGGILLKRIDPGVELNIIQLIQILQNTDKNFKIIDDSNETIFNSLKDINIGTHIINRFENIENYTMTELPYDNNLIKLIKNKKYDFNNINENYLTDRDFMLFCLRYSFTNINEVIDIKDYDNVTTQNLINITTIFNKLDTVCCNIDCNIYYNSDLFLLECLKININFIGFIPLSNYDIKYPEYLLNLFKRYPYIIKLLPDTFLNNPQFIEKYTPKDNEEDCMV